MSAAAPKTASRSAVSDDDALLRAGALTVRYGGVVAVDDVTMSVRRGTITGLIGPNGAGKTTTIDALSGYARYTGRVEFLGGLLDGKRPHLRQRAGLARTFQSLELFDDLTVRENVSVGATPSLRGVIGQVFAFRPTIDPPEVDMLLSLFGLDDLRDATVADLSQGERKLVTIARALASNPQLILLDEPAAGLDSAESLRLGDKLRQLRDLGTSMLLVDHDMNLVLTVCDYIYVLDFGRLVAEGTPAEVQTNPHVITAYLGDVHATADAGATS